MIGLIPSSMQMPVASTQREKFLLECCQSLSSVIAVSKAMNSDILTRGLFCLCYVTDFSYIPTAKQQLSKIVNTCDVFVVCPKLPRDAQIEWHFVSASEAGYREIVQRAESHDPALYIAPAGKKYSKISWGFDPILGVTQTTTFGYTTFVTIACKINGSIY
jgi:hypothetical protein